MDSLLFAINAVAPIVLMVGIGFMLKKAGFLKLEMAKVLNRLVFRVLLPANLFLNIYKVESLSGFEWGYILYAISAVLVIFLLAIPASCLISKKSERRGVLLQASFRSNYALVGIPLTESLFGEAGVMVSSLLSAVLVPAYNVLAVISLSIFKKEGGKVNIKKILTDIAKNPLILGTLSGVAALLIRGVLAKNGITFRLTDIQPVYKTISYLGNMATPLALLVLGVQFEFSAVAELKKEIVWGTMMRTFFAPLLGLGVAYLFFRDTFGGAHFASFVAVFATPIAVSSVPMAQEMKGDTTLAGQLVVWTTIMSALSVFVSSFLLRMAGVFG